MSPLIPSLNGESSKGDFMEYHIGDIVRTKKQHPCGSKVWEITRVGVDFKLKCQGCRSCGNATKGKGLENNYKENETRNRTREGIVPSLEVIYI